MDKYGDAEKSVSCWMDAKDSDGNQYVYVSLSTLTEIFALADYDPEVGASAKDLSIDIELTAMTAIYDYLKANDTNTAVLKLPDSGENACAFYRLLEDGNVEYANIFYSPLLFGNTGKTCEGLKVHMTVGATSSEDYARMLGTLVEAGLGESAPREPVLLSHSAVSALVEASMAVGVEVAPVLLPGSREWGISSYTIDPEIGSNFEEMLGVNIVDGAATMYSRETGFPLGMLVKGDAESWWTRPDDMPSEKGAYLFLDYANLIPRSGEVIGSHIVGLNSTGIAKESSDLKLVSEFEEFGMGAMTTFMYGPTNQTIPFEPKLPKFIEQYDVDITAIPPYLLGQQMISREQFQ